MTHRKRIEAVLKGEALNELPVSCRLDFWYRARQAYQDFPQEVSGLSLEQIQLNLGMSLPARKAKVFKVEYSKPVIYKNYREGQILNEVWETPRGVLRRTIKYNESDEKIGISPRIIDYPIKSKEDYRIYEFIMEHMEYIADYEEYKRYDKVIGENGFLMVILGMCPVHDLMTKWIGYGNVFFHMFDDPKVFEHAVMVGNESYKKMWDIVAESPCELVMHGVNFDSGMTSPKIFEQYFQPYLTEFNAKMHSAGKKVAFHADGDMSALLDIVVQTGFDIADCFACDPMVRCTLEQAVERWENKIIIWGGIPSTLLEATVDETIFKKHLEKVLDVAANYKGFIIGLADQAMPSALWERIKFMNEFFLTKKKQVVSDRR